MIDYGDDGMLYALFLAPKMKYCLTIFEKWCNR